MNILPQELEEKRGVSARDGEGHFRDNSLQAAAVGSEPLPSSKGFSEMRFPTVMSDVTLSLPAEAPGSVCVTQGLSCRRFRLLLGFEMHGVGGGKLSQGLGWGDCFLSLLEGCR